MLPDGRVGALREAPARPVGFVAAEPLARGECVRERGPDLVEHVAEGGAGGGVVGEAARGGRVRDVAGAGLVEDAVVGDGEADDAAEVRGREAAPAGEVGEGDAAVGGDVRGDVVLVDCLEAHAVQLRVGIRSAGAAGRLGGLGTCHRPEAHGRPEEELVEFEAGVEGDFAGALDRFVLDLEIDGAVHVERGRGEAPALEVLVHFGGVLLDLSS